MKLLALAWRYLWARPLVAALNLALLALGVAAMSFVVIVSEQVERSVQRDLAGVDLVVGAKGSPLQLILAGVFHLDVPTGNIPLGSIKTLREHPLVERVVPISLGDAYKGFRIVGTTLQYPALYGMQLADGGFWEPPAAGTPASPPEVGAAARERPVAARTDKLQAVLGADVAAETQLALGATFIGTHGLGVGGEAHGDTPYTVTGRFARCGCVLDRLVLTSLESVWAVHETATAVDEEDKQLLAAEREVTLLLVGYKSPLAAVSLPRWVNAQEGLQSAAPALESARLLRMVGAGTDVLRGFGVVLLLAAAASVFVGLVHAVREREPDLAMLRMLGAPPRRVAALVFIEALVLALIGAGIGLLLAQGLTGLLGWELARQRSLHVTGGWWSVDLAVIFAGTLVLALAAASLPAWRALRLDVSRLLQAPR
jgi:putative ABC transport system permease protein